MPSDHQSSAAGARSDTTEDRSKQSTILLRKLGSSGVPTYLERVVQEDGAGQFVVVERLPRGAMTEDEIAESVRDARLAATLEHPNVVRARTVRVGLDEIDVISDYVAGERLSELWSSATGPAKGLPLDIALQILIDVAMGLGALHKLRSEDKNERVKYVHGAVTPANVLVGLDGVSAILRAARVRPRNEPPTASLLAPEVLSGGPTDQRADIYGVGALLWELLSGHPPSPNTDVDAMLADARRGAMARAIMRAAPWGLPLGEVAARALDPVAEKRFPTMASMVTELRKIAGQRLATTAQIARFVESAAGEKIAARIQEVQASAVIRKATSIPPPRSVAPMTPAKPRTQPPAIAPPRSIAPKIPAKPRTEPPPVPRAVSAAPTAKVLPEPGDLPTMKLELAAPAAPPHPTAQPVLPAHVEAPKKPPARSFVAPVRSPAVARPFQTIDVEPTLRERLAQPAVIGLSIASLVVALMTGGLAWYAIRNRQPIVTPDAAMETSPQVAPVEKVVAPATAETAPLPVAEPPPIAAPSARPEPQPPPIAAPSARAEPTPPTTKATGTKSTEPRKAPPTKPRRK